MAGESPVLDQLELVIGNRADELPRVVAVLDELVRRHQLPDAALDMHVALDEVLSNIVKYAYADAGAHDIRIRLKVTRCKLEAEVEDDGRAFNPLLARQQDRSMPLAKRSPGGLGVSVVQRLMSELSYTREDGHNRLTLIRQLDDR